jgi:hypothetical protein
VIPPKTDPRWKALIRGTTPYKLKGLATRMLLTRVRLMGSRDDEQALAEAIDTAYEFFSRNREAQADIDTVFGEEAASLLTLEAASALVAEGKPLMIAGDEALLRALPRGQWIGGTIPYFMTELGGTRTQDRLFVTRLPQVRSATITLYEPTTLSAIPSHYPSNGVSFIIVPAASRALAEFAEEGARWKGLFDRPLVGWVAGVGLTDVGTVKPRVFDGSTGRESTDAAVVLHARLPDDLVARVDLINLFAQGEGEAITFPADGFEVRECLVDGRRTTLASFIAERGLDTRQPLVADYNGAMVNVSIQKTSGDVVSLFAPVHRGVTYRFARPLEGEYPQVFQRELEGRRVSPVFACNCILNYLYSNLEGRTTGSMVGPMTFGEIAWMLLNQTMVYVEFVPRG